MTVMPDPVDEAYAFLRAHTAGDLRFDEHVRPVNYVFDPAGRLIAPVMVAMLQAVDPVLFVPDLSAEAMELQLTLEDFDERGSIPDDDPLRPPTSGGALADRWRIHHGDPPDVNWALLHVDAARFREVVIDGDALRRPNPLAADEPQLCRTMNDRRDDLRVLCAHGAGIGVDEPVMVAIDPLGIDVRGRFEVVRVCAPEPMDTPEDATRILESMIAVAREGAGASDG
jgi:hypothetical protein